MKLVYKTFLAASLAATLTIPVQAADFKLTSPTLKPHGKLPRLHVMKGFGCEGENVSPALMWKNAPAGTKSFVITAYDPDAPTGSGWWHWVAYNIPANTQEIVQGAGDLKAPHLPVGTIQIRNDYGLAGFGGACPPVGDKPHRYIFAVHALKVEQLDVPADASAALIGYMVHMNSLGTASLQVTYGR